MDPGYLQYQAAAEEYVKATQQNPDVIGIVLSGSFIHGRIDPNSDLDVYVILDPICDYRERGNTWINSVEVEYFMNPPAQIRAYMRKEVSPHTAHMLANGQVVYRNSEIIAHLVTEAKEILSRPAPIMKDFQIELSKYQLDDLLKDLSDSRHRQDLLATTLLSNQFLDQGIDLFYKIHRIHRPKHKRLKAQLAAIDPNFADLLERIADNKLTSESALSELADYLYALLGGKRSREWRLVSGLSPGQLH